MAVTARWLIDKSALARSAKPNVAAVLVPRIEAGVVGICVVTELEVGLSARSIEDHDDILRLASRLVPIVMPIRAEATARQLQRQLVERGQHRAVGVPDLLVAAVAAESGLTVLHYDGDFSIISQMTGQPSEWIVPAGEAD